MTYNYDKVFDSIHRERMIMILSARETLTEAVSVTI